MSLLWPRHAQLVTSLLLLAAGVFFSPPLKAGNTTVPDRAAMPACAETAATGTNPYNRQLEALLRQSAEATPAQAAVLLNRAYRLRDYVDDPARVSCLLERVANDPDRHRLVRDEALQYLARIDVHNGNLQAAAAKLDELGFVRAWRLAGASASAVKEEPQEEQAQARDARGRSNASEWRKVPVAGHRMTIDLGDFYTRSGSAVAQAASSIYVKAPGRVALRLSADSGVELFVNGRRVFAGEARSFGCDQYAVAVDLRGGWNDILLKLPHEGETPWRFSLRVTGLEGGGVPFLAAAEAEEAVAIPAQPTGDPGAVAADLVDIAAAEAEAKPNSAEAREILGQIERQHARGEWREQLEAAAQQSPSAARWLEVAESCADGGCTFAALNRALRAEPEDEPARVALANYYFGRNQLEKARDLLRQALAREPADFVAGNLLADLYVSAGLNAEAFKESRRLEREFPKVLWLKGRLAARYQEWGLVEDAHRLIAAGLRSNFDDPEQRALLLRIYRRQRNAEGLRSAWEDMVRLNPANTTARAELAALEAGAGDDAAAERSMRSALALAPGDENLRGRAANLLALAGKATAAREELARALAINPNLEEARRRLRLSSETQPVDEEAANLSDPAAVAAEAQRNPAAANANAVKLSDVRIERVYENGLSSVREQQIYYIASEEGARQFTTRTVQYAPGAQKLRVLYARVYKRDGRIFEGEESGDAALGETQAALYYDVRRRQVRYPGVEKGDVVELDYRVTPLTNTNPYGDYFGELIVFRSNLPAKLQRFVLIAPAGRRLNIVERRVAPASVSVQGEARVYRWETRNQEPLPNEPKGPPTTETAPYVHVSSFHSWEELGRWYAQLIAPQFALDVALREQAARIVKGSASELERITAIHQFVLRNTHYVAMEFGIYSYKPYPVSQVYARRFGDCKDKASLMIALLRQAGIEAEIALVRTRRLGEIDPRATSVALFNHAIVYIPKYDLWLDGTAEYAGLRELPLEDQGAMALAVGRDGRAKLRYVPVTQPGDNYTRRTVRAQVLPDGRIQFEGVAYTRGEDAPGLRREYESPQRQRDAVRNTLAEVFPSVILDSVRVDGANDLEHPVTVEFRGALETYAGRASIPLSASWMPRSYVQQLAPLLSRTQDLLLPAPWTTEEELHFELPAGATLAALPADQILETRFGTATLRYSRSGRELVIRTNVQFRKLRIAPVEYEQFRQFCRQVERAFHKEIQVGLRG